MSFDVNSFFAALPEGLDVDELKALVPTDMWEKDAETAAVLALRRSGKFDEEAYLNAYPDVKESGMGAIEHYVIYGREEKRILSSIAINIDKNKDSSNFYIINKALIDQKPIVTIIISSYNHEKYLRDAIDSVLNQTLDNIEIICVDDFSSDNSVNVIKEYLNKDDRVSLIAHNKNMSANIVRKHGVQYSNGEYILFLDGDDMLFPNICMDVYESNKIKPVDILCFGTKIVCNTDIDICKIQKIQSDINPRAEYIESSELFRSGFIEKRFSLNLANKCISRNVATKAFSILDDIYIARGNDTYAFFAITCFSRSYLGRPDINGYRYNYGNGIYGNKEYTLNQFERLQQLSITHKAIDKISKMYFNNKYDDICNNIYFAYLHDCAYRLFNFIKKENIYSAYTIMIKYWGDWESAAALAWFYWNSYTKWCELIKYIKLKHQRRLGKVKNIAIYYHRLDIGGVQRVICLLSKMFINMNINVLIITEEKSNYDFKLPDGVKHLLIQKVNGRDSYYGRTEQLVGILKKYDIDTIHYNCYSAGYMIWDLVLFSSIGIRSIVHIHSSFVALINNEINLQIHTAIDVYSIADSVIVLSRADRALWGLFLNNVEYIPNPVENKNIVVKSNLENSNILYVGRISPEKRINNIVIAFSLVHKKNNNARLIIVGGSQNKNTLEQLKNISKEYGVYDYVSFEGYQKDVDKYFRKSSVVVIASKFEGYSMVLFEAKEHGVPVVMYDMPYLEMQRDNRGVVVVPQNDINLLADKMLLLINDISLRRRIGHEGYCAAYEFKKNNYIQNAWNNVFKNFLIGNNKIKYQESYVDKYEDISIALKTIIYASGTRIQELVSIKNDFRKKNEQLRSQLKS